MYKDRIVVTVIMPVYNAEPLLAISLESLLEQSYPWVELIVVNDFSNDNSTKVIATYLDKFRLKGYSVIEINHAENKGVAAARNTGLDHCSGDFIYFLDADDKLTNNAIKLLVDQAIESKSDVVGSNWYLAFSKNLRPMYQPHPKSTNEALELLFKGKMRWNLWLYLVKSSIYKENDIRFLDGENMGEDLMIMIKVFTFSRSISFVDDHIYYYIQSNSNSLTKTYSDRHREEVSTNLHEIEIFLKEQNNEFLGGQYLNYLKLNIKLPLLMSDNTRNYEIWREWFSESNDNALYKECFSFRIRIIHLLALKRYFFLLKCHYYFVIKFVYGVIYR